MEGRPPCSGGAGEGEKPLLDPFGLPLSEEALSMDGEFDLEQLEPKTRSVGAVLVPPPPLRRLGDGPFGAVQGVMGVQAYKPQQLVGSGAFAGVTKEHMARLDAKAPLPTAGSLAPSVTAGVKAAMRHDAGAYAAVPPALPMEEEGGVVADAAPRPVVVPEPPLLPFDISVFPIERCHFFTEKEPAALYAEVENALQEANVAFEFCPAKFKFSCEYFSGLHVVKFVTRAFRLGDGRVVVEFQRRAGCCLSCAKIMAAVRAHIAPHDARPEEPTLPDITEALVLKGEQVDSAQLSRHLERIRRVISTTAGEARSQLATVLIPVSQHCPEHMLRDPAMADLVADLCCSGADEVRLAGVACVANLAASVGDTHQKGGEGPHPWLARVVPPVVLALSKDKSPHVRREAARALMYLSRAKAFSRVVVGAGALEALRKHEAVNDRLLQGYVQQAVSNLVCVF